MNTRRVILGALLVFVGGWGALVILSVRESRQQARASDTERPPPAALTREEIARHDRQDDCWLVIRGRVYDVTPYIPSHPAPVRTITDYCGAESSWAFETKERGRPHSAQAWQMLETYFVGEASK